ncbi:shikimate dehydrogenase family protein [Blattabacterium cuenoti]|uniref:shikimate dehydrogenase family protein n=1 Tax=Blattabacterium cuenoti TaxID=1653831 RepID=UPI00163C16A0|nr:shikimate dehydrogenase [Blattabacterium cuenoti]
MFNCKKNYKYIFGLIGKDIHYSFSKEFFLKKFQKERINYAKYEVFDIPKIEKVSFIFKNPFLKGCNVTIPYKTSIIPFLTRLTTETRLIGSVNVIKIKDQHRIGYNTDVFGFELSFKKDIKKFLCQRNLKALILGTGGVSKAVSFVLKKLEIPYQYVSRKKNKNALSYEDINKNLLNKYKIIINCTPLGTYPNINFCPPLPYEYCTNKHYFYDMVYNPSKTLFIKKGKEKGAITRNGLDMLYLQAEESWKIWNS